MIVKIAYAGKDHRPMQERGTVDRDKVLDMWHAGYRSRTIAARLGVRRWQYVCHIVYAARRLRDPRAVRRGKGWNRGHSL